MYIFPVAENRNTFQKCEEVLWWTVSRILKFTFLNNFQAEAESWYYGYYGWGYPYYRYWGYYPRYR